ncbi:methyltransferase domain-containing protein [Deinococcus detaillensis]|uniref:Methyltransferase domain-containing protein n=1 Tax=Deinococcus detaillensis TaxID=2592048 RepID=A0A553V3A7_9DEIO|nr:methyltransferase domain-containing protein [Deinococcus detaillensis]TSA86711.1 methyltransferase domain-containing protein [Deinococcus detaillensis]
MSELSRRDARLSRLAALAWPLDPLLGAFALPNTAAILDIGAGEGQLLERLRQRGHSGLLISLDPVPRPGQIAGHAENLPFPSAQFNAALLIRVLLHVTDPARALAEAWRVLKVGGQLMVAVQGSQHLASFWALAEPAAERLGAEEVITRLLTDWPFQRTDIVLPVLLTSQDVQGLAESYGLSLPVLGRDLPDQLQLVVFNLKKSLPSFVE